MSDKTNGNGYGRVSFYAALIAAVVAIFGPPLALAFWVGGVSAKVEATSSSMDSQGKKLDDLAGQEHANEVTTSNMTRDLREVETQFCASDIVRNLMHANDMRTVSLLWQKVYGVPFPTNNAYYPTICNRSINDQGQ